MNIYEKLQSARVELQNKKLKKSGKNKFAGFDYFELSDFLPAVNEIFQKQKLFSQFSIEETRAILTIVDAEKTDETVYFSMPTAELELKGCNSIQSLGGVNTYCKRYLYLNALEICESDYFDAVTGKEEKKPKKAEVKKDEKGLVEDADLDIITGLAAIEDLKNLEIYYKENKDKVKDKDTFISLCKQRKEAINQ